MSTRILHFKLHLQKNSKLVEICTQFMSSYGCAKCTEGYYRNCWTVINAIFHVFCVIKINIKDFKPQNSIIGCNVDVKQFGCTKCKDGCLTLKWNMCETFSNIQVQRNKNSKCNKCSFWYEFSPNGTYREKKDVLGVIIVIILFIIFVLSILVIALVFSMKRISKMIHTKELEKTTIIFEIEKSNVKIILLANNICVSSKELNFNSKIEKIPVNTETKIVFCVGFMFKNVLKI
ncbi:hypothetical protein EIN_401750 [Entamoeba invadens IP1]|uniref:Uncharacterized protein n=1 Tax=Entamoeba invadens IP1 TaxID=370355 RepID=L7FM60_ENTIV|nr:hypothetical protein EIN_401750 [Entamoeba invadens IP1]ELP88637.1 hypothetical protein EIN_401750 [Entamoeba invadens IP1]|eukprot:XP_004255408.1 hypothetical protein EIN_401750 [Entamoeba invadens IP1]